MGPGADLPWTSITQGQYTVLIGVAGREARVTVWSRGGDWQPLVDGRPVQGDPKPVGSDYAFHTLKVRFTSSRRRVVEFRLANGAWLAGVGVGRGDSTFLPPDPARRIPSVYWLGDSFSKGTGARKPGFTDLVHEAQSRLGFPDVAIDALGGTGYVKANAGADFPNYVARVRRNFGPDKARPDVVVVAGSINDAGQGPGRVQRAARELYDTLASLTPDAKVFVVTFTSRFPVPPELVNVNEAVLAAAHSAPNVIGTLDLPRAAERAAAEDADSLQRSDAHPSQMGHALYGRLIARSLSRALGRASGG